MAPISEKTTIPLPWLVAGTSITFTTAITLALTYASIIDRLDRVQDELTKLRQVQWTTAHMELWIEKAKQRSHTELPSTYEVQK